MPEKAASVGVFVRIRSGGEGLSLSLSNITGAETAIAAALTAAGVTDAEIVAAAPEETGALAILPAVFKAYETLTCQPLDPEAKETAAAALREADALSGELDTSKLEELLGAMTDFFDELAALSDDELRERIRSIARSQGEEIPQEALVQAGGEGECAQRSVDLIRQGRGKLLIKGMLQTGTLLRAVVQPDTGIRASELLSHVAILDVPAYHKLMFVSDGGMVIAPDRNQKREILRNVLSLCRFLGYEQPKAAILCAAETVSPRMPETEDAAALKEEGARGNFGPCLVEGPISFDLATDRAAAEIKGYRSPVAGDADIFLVPSIAAGNLMCKALYGMAGGKMAGVVLGACVPITVNSRSAAPEEKYDSIAIAVAMAQSNP